MAHHHSTQHTDTYQYHNIKSMTLISSFALTIFLFTITTPLSWTPIAIFVLLACKLICFTHAILPQTSPGTILASASPPIDVFLLHEYHKVDPPRQCFPWFKFNLPLLGLFMLSNVCHFIFHRSAFAPCSFPNCWL